MCGEVKAVGGSAAKTSKTEDTERYTAEQALKQSLMSDLEFALEESVIVAITDQRGIITYVNEKFCEISKYSKAELLGQDHHLNNSGYHPKEFIRDLWASLHRT